MAIFIPSKSGDAMGSSVFTRFTAKQRRDYAIQKEKETVDRFDLNDKHSKKFREITRKQMQDLKNYQRQGLV